LKNIKYAGYYLRRIENTAGNLLEGSHSKNSRESKIQMDLKGRDCQKIN
jgi:hypothetical protein